MRKQKASKKRTRRLQRGHNIDLSPSLDLSTATRTSPLTPIATSSWDHKSLNLDEYSLNSNGSSRGRGRSRKRSQLYNALSSYHTHYLKLITAEFLAEEETVRRRIDASTESPISLETAGHALFDLYPERRGNIFSDEVYRLVKSHDATSKYLSTFESSKDDATRLSTLPPNCKFSQNDVIMLTLQPSGIGDFFGRNTLPTNSEATSIEARVLNTGPSYVDIAIPGGKFEATFGPAPNNNGISGKGDPNMRLRADRYFSNVPYNRMVAALGQITSVSNDSKVDESIRQAILSTFGLHDKANPSYQDTETYNLQELAKQLAKPPLKDSTTLANQVLTHLQSNQQRSFPPFNGPQLTSIGAALTRKLTMIQGPPGTGKTTVASSIAFGFVHQCRSISPNHKVLATAFSNCGADNLAEQIIRCGLKVVRVGKASAVSPILWDYTLDAAIAKDPKAKQALEEAATATANARQVGRQKGKKGANGRSKVDISNARNKRDIATRAVQASMDACNAAATKAMREADVIVCTSIGAADTRLLAACGILTDDEQSKQLESGIEVIAPDGLKPLKIPFVIIDEACQSVEPATLIPLLSTNSCRSLVMLGDPCQLPPTVISDSTGQGKSPLSISLMSRLSSVLPSPVIVTAQADKTAKEDFFLNLKCTRKAVSLIKYRDKNSSDSRSYRKRFAGSLLLAVQYRMHPSIAAFSSSVFYDALLSSPAFLSRHRDFPANFANVLPLEKGSLGVRLINVEGRNNERRGDSSSLLKPFTSEALSTNDSTDENASISNEAEASQIIELVKQVLANGKDSKYPFKGSIGIITPYSAQVSLIKSMMSKDSNFTSAMEGTEISIEVNSVDAYQGRERDVILFSAVRSNRNDNVGFLSDWRRMNVALTRAKSGLIVFGDMDTLKRGDKHWEGFCTWAEDMGCVFDVGDEEESS